jgi:hypothetical protein
MVPSPRPADFLLLIVSSSALSLSVLADQVRHPCVMRHGAFDDFQAVEFPPKSKAALKLYFLKTWTKGDKPALFNTAPSGAISCRAGQIARYGLDRD